MKISKFSFRPISTIRRTVLEQSALFFSVLRWTILATLIGSVTGASTWAFISLLEWSSGKAEHVSYAFLLAPVGMVLSTVIIRWLAPDAEGHGTEKVIDAVHRFSGRIPLKIAPVKTVATIVTIAAGGHHSLGLKVDGSVVAWGWMLSGKIFRNCAVQSIFNQ